MRERLQKILAQNGCGSRRDCEDLIREGRVSVGGKVVEELGLHIDPELESIKVDGQRLKLVAPCYFLLNKPRGVICTMSEDEKITRAIDFAPKGAGRVHTIGRLDKESEGLIILTNDGDLTERLTHPRHDMPKTYHVTVGGAISAEALTKMKKGVWLSDGKAKASSVKVLRHSPYASLLEIELREGKNRELRRILARVGYKVTKLQRISIGPIRIRGLGVGSTRVLTPGEVAILYEAVGEEKKAALAMPKTKASTRPAPGAHAAAGKPAKAPAGPAVARKLKKAVTTPAKAASAGKGSGGPLSAKAGRAAPAAGGTAAAAAASAPTAAPAGSPAPAAPAEPRRATRKDLPAFEPIRIVKKDGAPPRPATAPTKGARPEPALRPRAPAARSAQGERRDADPKGRPAAGTPRPVNTPRLPPPPEEPAPPARRAVYTPDEDGVIVVRRPAATARSSEEE